MANDKRTHAYALAEANQIVLQPLDPMTGDSDIPLFVDALSRLHVFLNLLRSKLDQRYVSLPKVRELAKAVYGPGWVDVGVLASNLGYDVLRFSESDISVFIPIGSERNALLHNRLNMSKVLLKIELHGLLSYMTDVDLPYYCNGPKYIELKQQKSTGLWAPTVQPKHNVTVCVRRPHTLSLFEIALAARDYLALKHAFRKFGLKVDIAGPRRNSRSPRWSYYPLPPPIIKLFARFEATYNAARGRH